MGMPGNIRRRHGIRPCRSRTQPDPHGGEPSLDRALDLVARIADGLASAHERGVIHRDVKPGNIRALTDRRLKITDIGIARLHGADAHTKTGLLLGSPRYLSPEQVFGRTADARAVAQWSAADHKRLRGAAMVALGMSALLVHI